MTDVICPTCGGSGHISLPKFKPGDRVIYDAGSHWGALLSTVLSVSKSRVKIKTDPKPGVNNGLPYVSSVTPVKLTLN